MDAFRRWQGKKALLQLSSSAAALALEWAKIGAGYGCELHVHAVSYGDPCYRYSAQHSFEARQFMLYARSGKVRSWLAEISQYLNRLSGPSLSAGENGVLKSARNAVSDAEETLAALLLV